MNKTLKFFITLFSILVCIPVFAETPAVSNSGDATQKKGLTVSMIQNDIKKHFSDGKTLDKEISISIAANSRTNPGVPQAIKEWEEKCNQAKSNTDKTHIVSFRFSDSESLVGLVSKEVYRDILRCEIDECSEGYYKVPDATGTTKCSKIDQKKGLCTNAKEHHLLAKYVDGVCTVESCVVGYELVNNVCVKKEKPAKTEKNSDTTQKRGLCTNAKEHHLLAKYVDGVCTVESCVVGYELVNNVCVKKEKPAKTEKTSDTTQKKGLCTNAKEHHLLAKYVDGVCTVESCVVGYKVSEDKKSCIKKEKNTKQGNEESDEQTQLEKELEKDINTLTKEFLSVVKSITKTCENGGGYISETGECIVPETTETNGARANKRTAGAKSRKR